MENKISSIKSWKKEKKKVGLFLMKMMTINGPH
jgi:hypothetical protein